MDIAKTHGKTQGTLKLRLDSRNCARVRLDAMLLSSLHTELSSVQRRKVLDLLSNYGIMSQNWQLGRLKEHRRNLEASEGSAKR